MSLSLNLHKKRKFSLNISARQLEWFPPYHFCKLTKSLKHSALIICLTEAATMCLIEAKHKTNRWCQSISQAGLLNFLPYTVSSNINTGDENKKNKLALRKVWQFPSSCQGSGCCIPHECLRSKLTLKNIQCLLESNVSLSSKCSSVVLAVFPATAPPLKQNFPQHT